MKDDKKYPRQTKWVNITSVCFDLQGSIPEAIQYLQELMAESDDPGESYWYWDAADYLEPRQWVRYLALRLERNQEPYSDESYLFLQGQRYETDDEYNTRVSRDKHWAAEDAAREKAEFERLQKKYGTGEVK